VTGPDGTLEHPHLPGSKLAVCVSIPRSTSGLTFRVGTVREIRSVGATSVNSEEERIRDDGMTSDDARPILSGHWGISEASNLWEDQWPNE
jgi:hypothetical protein